LKGYKLSVEFHWSPVDPKKKLITLQPDNSLDRGRHIDAVGLPKRTATDMPSDCAGARQVGLLAQESAPIGPRNIEAPHWMHSLSSPNLPAKHISMPRTSASHRTTTRPIDSPGLEYLPPMEDYLPPRLDANKLQGACRVFYRHLKKLYLTNETTDVERVPYYHYKTEDGRATGLRVLRTGFYLNKLSANMLRK
jgi:hypothetical protein